MERVSNLIEKIYHKYLPIVKKHGISLELDFPDTTLTIYDRERVEQDLEKSIRSAVERRGNISLTIRPGKIIVKDDGTTLSDTACKLLSNSRVKVKSRVGFGTTVEIS